MRAIGGMIVELLGPWVTFGLITFMVVFFVGAALTRSYRGDVRQAQEEAERRQSR